MTIDEAIDHCEEVAEKNDKDAEIYDSLARNHKSTYEKLTAAKFCTDCAECASDHRQLAAWLRELKEYRADDWKKVEEDLPKAWYQVLVYRANGIIEMAMYTGELWLSMYTGKLRLSITQESIKDVAYWKYTKEPKGERLDDMLELIGGAEDDD